MNNAQLFEALAKHYNLDPDDWYQLHGLWILKHNAVRKISKQKTKDGHTIVLPVKLNVLKDGTVSEGGVHGPEVVFSGEFRLVDDSGKTVHQVLSIGEANKENCKLPYSWAMAYKRFIDRGVLDLLSFAELGVYSASEADSFAAAAPDSPVVTAAPLPTSTRAVDPPAPPPAIPTPAGGGAPTPRPPANETATIAGKDPEDWQVAPPAPAAPPGPRSRRLSHDEAEDLILEALDTGVHRPKKIRDLTGLTQSQYQRAIVSLIEFNKVTRTGQKAGTRYYLAGEAPEEAAPAAPEAPAAPVRLAPAPPAPAAPPAAPQVEAEAPGDDPIVHEDEFNTEFDKAMSFGVTYLDVLRIMTNLTGCSVMSQAHEEGKITRSVVDKLLRLAEERAA